MMNRIDDDAGGGVDHEDDGEEESGWFSNDNGKGDAENLGGDGIMKMLKIVNMGHFNVSAIAFSALRIIFI